MHPHNYCVVIVRGVPINSYMHVPILVEIQIPADETTILFAITFLAALLLLLMFLA